MIKQISKVNPLGRRSQGHFVGDTTFLASNGLFQRDDRESLQQNEHSKIKVMVVVGGEKIQLCGRWWVWNV